MPRASVAVLGSAENRSRLRGIHSTRVVRCAVVVGLRNGGSWARNESIPHVSARFRAIPFQPISPRFPTFQCHTSFTERGALQRKSRHARVLHHDPVLKLPRGIRRGSACRVCLLLAAASSSVRLQPRGARVRSGTKRQHEPYHPDFVILSPRWPAST